MKVIEFRDVFFKYNNQENNYIINNISFSINKGSFTTILGSNGSGKSTIAKLINGLLMPNKGDIFVNEMNTKDKNCLFDIRKTAGMVFQNPDNQMIATIVEDDIAFGPENIGINPKEIGERIDFALKSTEMEEYRFSSGQRLSGGQKQRIAIAGVLAMKPEILILDESTSMLDPKGRQEVMKIIKKLNQENGITVICITHYMDEVVDADNIIIVNDGVIVLEGTPREIFRKEKELNNFGLDVPKAVYISNRLRERGLALSEVLTMDELSEELCKLFVKI